MPNAENPKAKKTSKKQKNEKKETVKLEGFDYPLLVLSLSILAFGLIMVQSAGAFKSFNENDANVYYYLFQQLKWAGLGILAAGIIAFVPYTFWRRFAGLGILITLVLLMMVRYSDVSMSGGGAARWLKILGFSVQPSEIAKLCSALFLAHVFDRYPLQNLKALCVPGVLIALMLALIYKQPDLGTTIVLAATCAAMIWQTGLASKWFFIAGPPVVMMVAVFVYKTEYQWKRILVWLDPWKYAVDEGYQVTNAAIAFGTGGLFGLGLGESVQKYGALPENHTDYIFAIVGEELGLLGCLILITLFAALFFRSYQLARCCPDRFGRLLAFGLTTSLAIQTTVNMAVVTGVFPTTGITLPFISYGGSSLLITLAQVGILLNISRYRTEKQRVKVWEKGNLTVSNE
ncbi:MAG: putative lipid II flippase FtsW [Peptococcaceae bacterium]|jgi:cell division protein FtsW|nr:putative lipid II flippase FtsW [Peptococcaceae bacterium]